LIDLDDGIDSMQLDYKFDPAEGADGEDPDLGMIKQ
jgi:hypothetical protein